MGKIVMAFISEVWIFAYLTPWLFVCGYSSWNKKMRIIIIIIKILAQSPQNLLLSPEQSGWTASRC